MQIYTIPNLPEAPCVWRPRVARIHETKINHIEEIVFPILFMPKSWLYREPIFKVGLIDFAEIYLDNVPALINYQIPKLTTFYITLYGNLAPNYIDTTRQLVLPAVPIVGVLK